MIATPNTIPDFGVGPSRTRWLVTEAVETTAVPVQDDNGTLTYVPVENIGPLVLEAGAPAHGEVHFVRECDSDPGKAGIMRVQGQFKNDEGEIVLHCSAGALNGNHTLTLKATSTALSLADTHCTPNSLELFTEGFVFESSSYFVSIAPHPHVVVNSSGPVVLGHAMKIAQASVRTLVHQFPQVSPKFNWMWQGALNFSFGADEGAPVSEDWIASGRVQRQSCGNWSFLGGVAGALFLHSLSCAQRWAELLLCV
jgi:hypothetical protein